MVIAAVIGLLLGFLGSIPVAGPIAALVFSLGVQGRFRSGVFIAVGGGIAEAIYAFMAFWGFSTFLTRYELVVPISRALGGVILIALGLSFLFGKVMAEADPDKEAKASKSESDLRSFALGFGITALNPTLIATWTAAVTTLYSTEAIAFSSVQAVPFALGTAVGIAGWFFILLALIRRYRDRFSVATLVGAVRAAGLLLLGLAVWFIVRFVQYLLGQG